MTLEVSVIGIGVLGPGLPDWRSVQWMWTSGAAWQAAPTVVPAPERLPATERRRAGAVVKAAIVVADQALAASGADAATLATVFTSSTGDPSNCHLLCEALATTERMVSPTRFTNSVHNAPAGYWHIATSSRAASTSLAAFDASFAAGMLEAAVQCQAAAAPVLLVACDVPYPEPLHGVRPITDVFAVALVLAPKGQAGRALHIDVVAQADATRCDSDALEAVCQGIPAARALPLLQALAADQPSMIVIEGLPGMSLRIQVGAP
jgi:Beta-ketoacyl synthase, N-terminal domain